MTRPTVEQRFALISGANGGIGSVLVDSFRAAGFQVIGTDITSPAAPARAHHFIECDLRRLVQRPEAAVEFCDEVRGVIGSAGLSALINNAATQVVDPVPHLSADDFSRSLDVNVLAPFILVQALLDDLVRGAGSVVNISSIHARLTKLGFVAYATSKAALSGLTRALGVEIGGRVRVNAIAPAAIETPMLRAGLRGDAGTMDLLAGRHPVGRIGKPEEVADLALFLVSAKAQFINGTVVELDGGIGARLHDVT